MLAGNCGGSRFLGARQQRGGSPGRVRVIRKRRHALGENSILRVCVTIVDYVRTQWELGNDESILCARARAILANSPIFFSLFFFSNIGIIIERLYFFHCFFFYTHTYSRLKKLHCERIESPQFAVCLDRCGQSNLLIRSGWARPFAKRGKPAAFGAKLRIYAAHNPTILQMVANLSMPTYYRFHFPTWMETYKGLKNCFCPLFVRVVPHGWGGGGAVGEWSFDLFHPARVRLRRKVRRRLFTTVFSPIPVFL